MAAAAPTSEPDTMEAVLNLSPEEARTYSKILDAAAVLPKSDPRFALTLTFTWWLLHRRRRLEQHRVRKHHFFRRFRRLIFMRRQHLLQNTLAGVVAAESIAPAQDGLAAVPEKRLWVRKDKNEDFWTKVDQNTISPDAFQKHFHMSRETFDYVYDELAEQLQKSNTSMRDPLPGKKRLAATIYRMATNAEYIKVANLFGIGKSTTTSLVRDVCEVIVANLKDKFLTFVGEGLKKEDMQRKINDAANSFGIPRVVGVLGSIDVLIIGSSWDWSENSPYISSYHKNYAVTFQSVVDHDGQFCHVSAGTPSSLSNRQTLEECGLRKDFLDKFSSPTGVDGTEQLPIARIIADESYSGQLSENGEKQQENTAADNTDDSEWLLTPGEVDKEIEDESERQLLKERMTQAQALFDDAIFKVKCRWKIFHGKNGKINFSADAFEKIALACCILHNICSLQEDEVQPIWSSDVGPEVYNRRGHPKEKNAENVEIKVEGEVGDEVGEEEGDEEGGNEEEDFEAEFMEDEEVEGGDEDEEDMSLLMADVDADMADTMEDEAEHSMTSADDANNVESNAVGLS